MEQPVPTNLKQMIAAANAAVRRITPEDARAMMGGSNALLVDVRDPGEVAESGMLAGAINISRGMLEFRADPDMPSHNPAFDRRRPIILYCASGGRSALAGKALLDLGYEHVSNLGAFKDAVTAGLPIQSD
jgi:rhodanese-related sulfurtransferase